MDQNPKVKWSRCLLAMAVAGAVTSCEMMEAPSVNMLRSGSSVDIPNFANRLTSTQAAMEKVAVLDTPRSGPSHVISPGGMPRASTVPQTTAWILQVKPTMLNELIATQEDLSARNRGWWRAGDGSLAVKVKTAKGRSLRSHECGGVLITETDVAKGCRLQLRNMLDRRIEVVADVQGQDLFGQPGFPNQRRGVVLLPGQIKTIKTMTDAKGNAVPLACDVIRDVQVSFRHDPAHQPGVIRLSVFLSTDYERLLPPQRNHAMPSAAPQRSAEARARAYEYR